MSSERSEDLSWSLKGLRLGLRVTTCLLTTRRAFLAGATIGLRIAVASAVRDPGGHAAAIKEWWATGTIREGRGEARSAAAGRETAIQRRSPCRSRADDPADHVQARSTSSTSKNPQPMSQRLARAQNGKAVIATRISFADSQKIIAIARPSTRPVFPVPRPT